MKETELRIGNWYYGMTIGGYWIESQVKDGKHIDVLDGCSVDEAKPIPLTEEWLERFGAKFELVENYRRYFVLDYNVWQHYHISKAMPNMKENLLWSFTVNNNDGKSYELYSITYVHQLQNLYFALTGKELELK